MSSKGLIFMERSHPAVLESVRRIVTLENSVAECCVRDFDANEFVVRADEDGTMKVSLRPTVPVDFYAKNCAEELQELLQKHFKRALMEEADEGTIATVCVPVPEDETERASIVKHPMLVEAAALRTITLAAPFFKAINALKKKTTFALRVPYREKESLYVYTSKGGVNVVISIRVPDLADRMLVRTFLLEFAEAKRRATSGPTFSFLHGEAPPLDGFKQMAEPEKDPSIFWVQFGLSNQAIEQPEKTEKCVEFLVNFRAYIMYHMQCARAAMHAKMRGRVASSLLVLNRAKTSTTGQPRISIE